MQEMDETNDQLRELINKLRRDGVSVQQRLDGFKNKLDRLQNRIDEAEENIEDNTRIRYVAIGVGLAVGALAGVVAGVLLL